MRTFGDLIVLIFFVLFTAFVLLLSFLSMAKSEIVTVTAYSQDTETASGSRPGVGTVAVSRDLLEQYPFGSLIHLDGISVLEVCDVMHKKKCKSVDVYTRTGKEAKAFGVKKKKLMAVHRAKKQKGGQTNSPAGSGDVQKGRQGEVSSWAGPLPSGLFTK